jgi:hypothetical protein
LTPQPLNAQPEVGDAEERLRRGSNKRAQPASTEQLYFTGVFDRKAQPFQFIARDAVTVRRTLEGTMGISITAETPVFR